MIIGFKNLLTYEEEFKDGAHHCEAYTMFLYLLLNNEKEIDYGAHHCVAYDDPLDAPHR